MDQMLLSMFDPQSIDSVLDTDTYCLWFSYDVNIHPIPWQWHVNNEGLFFFLSIQTLLSLKDRL